MDYILIFGCVYKYYYCKKKVLICLLITDEIFFCRDIMKYYLDLFIILFFIKLTQITNLRKLDSLMQLSFVKYFLEHEKILIMRLKLLLTQQFRILIVLILLFNWKNLGINEFKNHWIFKSFFYINFNNLLKIRYFYWNRHKKRAKFFSIS